MKKLLNILLLTICFFGYGHDIKMAIFEIYEGESSLEMSISLDKEDFLATLSTEFHELTSENLELLAFQYLDSKIAININGECTTFTIDEVEFSDLNIHIRGSLNIQINEVKEVQMTNTCMIELFKDHDNIMKLKLNDRTRSFRLNQNRTSTIATY